MGAVPEGAEGSIESVCFRELCMVMWPHVAADRHSVTGWRYSIFNPPIVASMLACLICWC